MQLRPNGNFVTFIGTRQSRLSFFHPNWLLTLTSGIAEPLNILTKYRTIVSLKTVNILKIVYSTFRLDFSHHVFIISPFRR